MKNSDLDKKKWINIYIFFTLYKRMSEETTKKQRNNKILINNIKQSKRLL